jgi:hypothetical protein
MQLRGLRYIVNASLSMHGRSLICACACNITQCACACNITQCACACNITRCACVPMISHFLNSPPLNMRQCHPAPLLDFGDYRYNRSLHTCTIENSIVLRLIKVCSIIARNKLDSLEIAGDLPRTHISSIVIGSTHNKSTCFKDL